MNKVRMSFSDLDIVRLRDACWQMVDRYNGNNCFEEFERRYETMRYIELVIRFDKLLDTRESLQGELGA